MLTPFDLPFFGSPIMLAFCGVLLVVLRAGASRVFFDVVGTFQSQKLLNDAEASITTLNSLALDGLGGIEEAGAMIAEQMQAIVDATVPLSTEIEKATLEFEKFIDTGRDVEGAIAKQVREAGMQFGFTATESLEAGARMAQLSTIITQEAVPAATEMALAFGLIGDMTPERAMQKLINLQQQTSFMFQDMTEAQFKNLSVTERQNHVRKEMANVLNQLNSVEDRSAATMSKITGVMNEFASQAHLTGESMAFMAAMSATLIEAGEEQGKGGRALRMIYARLGANTSGAADALQSLGVETKNTDGSLRALSDILRDLKPTYDRLNSGQKQALAQQVAGNRHYVRFLKLAENFDRVITLQQEAVGETAAVYDEAGNAVGFLDDMMKSNVVTLEEARNRLELVNAQFGDLLVPHLIAATNFQISFNQELFHMLGHLKGTSNILQGFLEFQQIVSTTFAPFFSAMINVKAMNIALMTQRQISRALSGEQLARVTKSKADQEIELAQMDEKKMKLQFLLSLTDEERAQQLVNSTERKAQMDAELLDLQAKQIGLEGINMELLQGGTYEGNNAKITLASNRLNKALKAEALQSEKNLNQAKAKGVKLNEIAGTSLKAMALRTDEVNLAKEALILALREEKLITDAQIDSLKQLLFTHEFYIEVLEDGTRKLNIASAAGKIHEDTTKAQTFAVMRLSMVTMKLSATFMLLDMLVMMFKDSLPGIRDETHAARIAMILMTAGMVVMTAEMIITMGMTVRLAAAKGAEAGASIAAAVATGILTMALNAQTVATITASRAFTIMTSLMSGGAFIAAALLIVYAVDKFLLPAMTDVTDISMETADAMAATSIEAERMASDMQFAFDGLDFSGLEMGTQAMEEFGSAREEMFFGFKAGQVTGDLVKQVQQGGVENFVANTEIIMNNNFNGMTTEEVADEIIGMIERKSGVSGLNASVVTN